MLLVVSALFIGTFCITESADCGSQRALQRQASDTTAPGYYEVQCDATDAKQYVKQQCWPSTGRCWCVDTYGAVIPGSHVNPGQDLDCDSFGWCTSKTNTYLAELGEETPPPGAPTPACDDDGNFALSQSWGSTGEQWCAVPNGNEIPGTKTGPGKPAKDCANLPACLAKEGTLAHLSVDNFYPLGLDRPECDPQGLFQSMQCHGSTGYCWCVNVQTGVEINGTRKGPGDGPLNCETLLMAEEYNETTATSCQRLRNTQKEHLEGSASPIVGFWTVSCQEDGSFEPSQCHPSSGRCWCVDEDGMEIQGSASAPGVPKTPCGVSTACTDLKTLQESQNQHYNFIGMFVPECEVDGSFKSKQCWGSTGQCWCVTSKGQEITYTRRGPTQKPSELDCSGSSPPKKVSSVGQQLQDEETGVEEEGEGSSDSNSSTMIIIIGVLACLLVFVTVAAIVYIKRNAGGPKYTEVNATL